MDKDKGMTEKELTMELKECLEMCNDYNFTQFDCDNPWQGDEIIDIQTFKEIQMFTNNNGLVLTMNNGDQFTITIQKF